MLLAHSRTSSHCEPITVILAEVEAPELAAILGFVYTGSATVARPRLNAFLHAAEALHIRLPPVPVVMTCSETDCKQEDAKDVKIGPRYSECDRYPCRDRWHRLGGDRDGGSAGKEDPYPRIESLEAAREIGTLPESMNFAAARYAPRYCSATWPVPFASPAARSVHGVDQLLDKDETNRMDVGRYPVAVPIDKIDAARSASLAGCESSIKRPDCCPASPYHGHRQLDPLELRIRSDQCHPGANDDALGDLMTGENSFEEDRACWIGSCHNRATSLQLAVRRPCEKSDYGWDLTCRESCFAWRTPKRHVANRVIASPWRQTIRPYHLPKLQPIVLQPHPDETVSTLHAFAKVHSTCLWI